MKETKQTIEQEARKCNLKAVSEAKLLEGYNRRDVLRIIGIPEERCEREKGRKNFDDYGQSLVKVLNVAREAGAEIEKTDISIAHRLPGRNTNSRPMIVRFSRQIAKVKFLRKKPKPIAIQKIHKFFDVFNLMKQDSRV